LNFDAWTLLQGLAAGAVITMAAQAVFCRLLPPLLCKEPQWIEKGQYFISCQEPRGHIGATAW